MIANNIFTLIFFSFCAILLIYALPNELKRYSLFVLNFVFYFLLSPYCVFLILLSTIVSFFIGQKITSSQHAKLWLISGIIFSVSILLFFKYYHFFTDRFSGAIKIIMPLGLSYYTFKIISYLADIYIKKRSAEPSFINYSIYIGFFPQIMAGPISNSNEILDSLPQLGHATSITKANSFSLIISGLFKKIVIADRISVYTDQIFATPNNYPSIALILSSILYSIQIYCDFSGYSDISIGVSGFMGIKCSPNFDLPYFSYSIQDFWRRWHISLSSWLKKYIYIPLGGNRHGRIHRYINILITFLISVAWHGNSLTYIVWGLFHGICNLFSFTQRASRKIVYFLQILFTFLCVTIGWIIFRSTSLNIAFLYIKHMFIDIQLNTTEIVASLLPFTSDYSCLAYFVSLCILIIILFYVELCEFRQKVTCLYLQRNYIFILCIIFFGIWGQSNFLYANF